MDDATALLAAVIRDRADDNARLVLADHMQEYGGPALVARAEFIRLQIALARLGPPRVRMGAGDHSGGAELLQPAGPDYWQFLSVDQGVKVGDRVDVVERVFGRPGGRKTRTRHGLVVTRVEPDDDGYGVMYTVKRDADSKPWAGTEQLKRSNALLKAWASAWLPDLPGYRKWAPLVGEPGLDFGWVRGDKAVGLRDVVPEFSRGCVSAVSCSAADWLKCEAALSWHPEQSCDRCFGEGDGVDETGCRFCGSTGTAPCPPTAHPVERVTLAAETATADDCGRVPDAMLDAFGPHTYRSEGDIHIFHRWPTIEFKIPPLPRPRRRPLLIMPPGREA